MSEWNDTEMVEALAKSVMDKVATDQRRPMFVPATVVGADTTVSDAGLPLTAIPYFSIHVDTDPAGVTIQAASFARWPFTPGDRVMIAWDRPHAAYILYPLQGIPSGRPYSTFVVAGLESYAPGHLEADYVCDGIADDVELTAAFARVTAEGVPGRVLLLEGTYTMATDTLTIPAGVTLAGLGRDVVTLYFTGSGVALDMQGGTVEDLTVFIADDGYVWDMVGTQTGKIRRTYLDTQGGV